MNSLHPDFGGNWSSGPVTRVGFKYCFHDNFNVRLDIVVVVILMLLPMVILEGITAYIWWIVVTGAYIVYMAHKTKEWVD